MKALSADTRTIWALMFGLAAGPTAWIAQLVLDYGLSSHACFPVDHPVAQLPAGAGKPALAVITALCFLLALAGLWTAWISWRDARDEAPAAGRSCFLALCGLYTSAGFAVAILASAASILAVPSCWAFAS
jgi:hypothetical protein